jgi:hypothetical protein
MKTTLVLHLTRRRLSECPTVSNILYSPPFEPFHAGSGSHLATYTVVLGDLFLGRKWPGRESDHSPLSIFSLLSYFKKNRIGVWDHVAVCACACLCLCIPLNVARQRLSRNIVFNVARVVSTKVGHLFFPELLVYMVALWNFTPTPSERGS